MLSADEWLEMPLVLHISDSCVLVYFYFFYRVVSCLVTLTMLHSNTQSPQPENNFPVETLCFWMCPG